MSENKEFMDESEDILADLVALSMVQLKSQLEKKQAPASSVNLLLKYATTRETEKTKRELIGAQRDLAVKKAEAIEKSEESAEIYQNAMDALQSYGYTGHDSGA